jgi:restriction system protein
VTAKEIIRDFEIKNKYTSLLNGSNLLHLLEKHGHKAKIDLKEAKKTFSN